MMRLGRWTAMPRIAGLTKRRDALWFTDFERELLVGIDLPSGVDCPLPA